MSMQYLAVGFGYLLDAGRDDEGERCLGTILDEGKETSARGREITGLIVNLPLSE